MLVHSRVDGQGSLLIKALRRGRQQPDLKTPDVSQTATGRASQHTRTPTPCCCGTSRNPPVQALQCLDAPSDVEAAPFPSEHRKVHALGLPRERAHHCDNTLSSSCNQRWFNAFNTFASTRLQPICQLSPSCDWQSELGLRVIRLAVLLHKSGSPSAGVEPGLLLVQGHRATQLYTRRVELGHLL